MATLGFDPLADSATRVSAWLRAVMEAVVLAMVCFSPWAFGAVSDSFLGWLYVGVGGLLCLWAARMVLERRLIWTSCPLAWCLAGLFLFGMLQLVTLPSDVLALASPATVRLNRQLLPPEPEVLPEGLAHDEGGWVAGHSISLYPGATRREAIKLLAIWLLFEVIRNNVASAAALARLSVALVINGALLAFVGIVQAYSSSPRMIYGIYPAEGSAFGPFVCRNHFSFYVNVAIGLGIGLLLSLRHLRSRYDRDVVYFAPRGVMTTLLQPLREPVILWISLALGLMVVGVFMSLSRGGVLSLLTATALVVCIRVARSRRITPFEGAALLFILGLGVVSWMSLEQVEKRLGTLWKGNTALGEGRVRVWANVVPLAAEFPLWGTGLGTFRYVEPLQRGPKDDPALVWDHAHNEYLEALIEGGVVRLLLSLVGIALVYRVGLRAVRRYRGRLGGGLALGALLGFTAIVLHSVVDFGLHIPAIAVLAAVLAAYLAELGKPRRIRAERRQPATTDRETSPRVGRLPLIGVAAMLLAFAVLLYGEGCRWGQAQSWRYAAEKLASSKDLAMLARQLTYFEAAVRATPEDAEAHFELAQALLDQYEKETEKAPANPTGQATLREKYLAPALAHALRSRDLCPLQGTVQLWLADQAPRLARAEPRAAYLARAKLVWPAEPSVWFFAGEEALAAGRPDEACPNWRRNLLSSTARLPDILKRSRPFLDDQEMIANLLPDQPELLVEAGKLLHPRPDEDRRRPFLEKALALLQEPDGSLQRDDVRLQAEIWQSLGQPEKAIAVWQRAVEAHPEKLGPRFELAQLLYQQGQLSQAREQLSYILSMRPNHGEARQLLAEIDRER